MKYLFLLFLSTSLHAQILSKASIADLLGDFPPIGSEASEQDYAELMAWQKSRTELQCEQAAHEESPTLINFFASEAGPLTKQEAERLTVAMFKVYFEAGVNIKVAKDLFKRPRPYETWNELEPCIKEEESYAYPSGHATLAYLMASYLIDKFPERRELIIERAEQIAHHRILGGVHHPSDIEAAKKLAERLAFMYQNN